MGTNRGPVLRRRKGSMGSPRFLRLGPVGTTAVVAAFAAVSVAIVIALTIPRIVEQHLLETAADTLHESVDGIARTMDISTSLTETDLQQLRRDVDRSLLGREIVRVKIWDREGTVVYSDEEALVGSRFAVSDDLAAAFEGAVISGTPELDRPENAYDRDFGALREYYIPVDIGPHGIEVVFEVYEQSDKLVATVRGISGAVWFALITGAVLLLAALGIAAVVNERAERKRRRQAQQLISQLLRVQEDERTRIIGALHDDIGQPLYRILFGLQAGKQMAAAESDLRAELDRIEGLVREVDVTLRSELTALRDEPGVEIDLEAAIVELAEATEAETGLDIGFTSNATRELPLAHRATLYRATKEAVSNVVKHAHATAVEIRLREEPDGTIIEVTDDGAGPLEKPGLGLTTTKDRLEAIGGGIDVNVGRAGGTRFLAWVPNEEVRA